MHTLGTHIFRTKLVVEQCRCSFVSVVSIEAFCVVGYRPVRRLVSGQFSVFQPGERSANCALANASLGGGFTCLEGTIIVRSEAPEDLLRDRKIREVVLECVFTPGPDTASLTV
jgi:hypothetical protein